MQTESQKSSLTQQPHPLRRHRRQWWTYQRDRRAAVGAQRQSLDHPPRRIRLRRACPTPPPWRIATVVTRAISASVPSYTIEVVRPLWPRQGFIPQLGRWSVERHRCGAGDPLPRDHLCRNGPIVHHHRSMDPEIQTPPATSALLQTPKHREQRGFELRTNRHLGLSRTLWALYGLMPDDQTVR